ncbi:MAG: hypothetical protein R6U50_06415 [Desulfobacterales bacterium]
MNERVTDFIHPDLNEEVRAIGGGYSIIKEDRLHVDGREVLFMVGHAVFDTSCCGTGGCGYAIVPGFVMEWKSRRHDSGRFISRIQPISDPDLRKKIKSVLKEKELVQEVRFNSEFADMG